MTQQSGPDFIQRPEPQQVYTTQRPQRAPPTDVPRMVHRQYEQQMGMYEEIEPPRLNILELLDKYHWPLITWFVSLSNIAIVVSVTIKMFSNYEPITHLLAMLISGLVFAIFAVVKTYVLNPKPTVDLVQVSAPTANKPTA